MWQRWFLYWGVFIITLIVFFIPNISTGQFQSFDWQWLSVHAHRHMLIFWVRTELVDTLSHQGLLIHQHFAAVFSWTVSCTSQCDLPQSLFLFPVWSLIFTPPPFSFPQVRFFCALSCRAGSAPSLCQAHPGLGHSFLLSSVLVICNAVQLGDSTHW